MLRPSGCGRFSQAASAKLPSRAGDLASPNYFVMNLPVPMPATPEERFQRFIFAAGLYIERAMKLRVALILLVLSGAMNLYWATRDVGWLTVPALFAGWYVADMQSGLVHMFMDYHPCPAGRGLDRLYFYKGSRASAEYQALFKQTMAGLNPFQRLVYDFKNHHPRPHALGRRTLWRQIGSTVIVGVLPVSLLFNLLCWVRPVPGWVAAGVVAMLIGGTFAQYFHGTLHREDNPWIIRTMRRAGLLMTPEAHQLHHDTLRRDFSTNCGWSNGVVNRVFRFAHQRGYLADAGLEPAR
jgi:hypothetical protein